MGLPRHAVSLASGCKLVYADQLAGVGVHDGDEWKANEKWKVSDVVLDMKNTFSRGIRTGKRRSSSPHCHSS